jgi:pyrroline-5-carboxylate reductase
MKIAFIGGGNMGEAMLSAVLEKGLGLPQDIAVSDINESRLQHLHQKYHVGVTGNNQLVTHRAQVVVLAVKPQNLGDVMAELSGHLRPALLLLSIIAGARIDTLCQGLEHPFVVRAMPNTPAQIGEGITVWTATSQVAQHQKEWARSILGVMGKEVYVDDERLLDMATAVSGSGPAYLYFFIEALTDAAVHIGLPRDVARELVMETVLGAAHLLQKSGKDPAELRKMVTSPGGTTAAAIAKLEEADFASLILQAISAAHDRAKELGSK